jgi:hypothetical protein
VQSRAADFDVQGIRRWLERTVGVETKLLQSLFGWAGVCREDRGTIDGDRDVAWVVRS